MQSDSAISGGQRSEARFFFVMACIMATLTIAGFALMLALGISSLDRPWIYHVHGVAFLAWTFLYVAQNALILKSNLALHRRMGRTAAGLIPLMFVLVIALSFVSLRTTGGPPFFDQAEFLVVNIFHISGFVVLAGWGLKLRRQTDWHRRLMFGAMATVGAPGLARLLPLPLTVPHTFSVLFVAALIFPIIGMIADKKIHGRVHPAWIWTIVVPLVALGIGETIASLPGVESWTAEWVQGTPGAERPAEAFVPLGF